MKVGYSFEGLVNRVTAVDESAVHKTGDETVAGLKTFTSCPASSGVQGTAGTHLTRRDFVLAELNKKVNLVGSSTITGNVTVTGTLSGVLYHSSGHFNFANFSSDYGDGRLQGFFREHDNGAGTGFLGLQLDHRDATGAVTGKQIDIVMNGNYVYHTGRPPTATAVGAYSKAESDAGYVNRTGAQTIGGAKTFSSNLTAPAFLSSAAQNTAANAATRKDYVDAEVAKQVSKTGDTMTGPLLIQASTSQPLALKSTTVGVTSGQYIIGVDSTGASRWYVGQGAGGSADVFLHSYGHGTSVRLGADNVAFNKDPISLVYQGSTGGSLVRRDYLEANLLGQTPDNAITIPGNANLNTYQTAGFYNQSSNGYAISGSNYPVPLAGALVIYKAAGIRQDYHVYGQNLSYTRAFYLDQWTNWSRIYTTTIPPSPSEVGAVSLSGNDVKAGQLIVAHSGIPLVLRSTATGVTQSNYLLAQDSAGTNRWYVGQGNAGNTEVVLHSYTLGTNLRLAAGAVIASKPLQDNSGTTFTTGRLPTAAQGNSDVVAGSYQNIGAYVLAANINAAKTSHGQTTAGSALRPTSCWEFGPAATSLPGTWRCMGDITKGNDDSNYDDRTTLYMRVA